MGNMKSKPIQLKRNSAKGIDLLTERDAGNEILILTGKPERSLAFWKKLRILCDTALSELGHASGREIATAVTLIDKDPEADHTPQVVLIEADSGGIIIQPVGYGDLTSENGFGWPILMEKFGGKLQVVVWSDINQEDPTHKIDLAGAKESCREPIPAGTCPRCGQLFAVHNGDGSCVRDETGEAVGAQS
jgi:hypothetical protein